MFVFIEPIVLKIIELFVVGIDFLLESIKSFLKDTHLHSQVIKDLCVLLLKPKSVTTYLQHITYAYASSLKEPFAQTKRKFKILNLSKTYVYLRII